MDVRRQEALGVPQAHAGAVARWLELLREWNARIDLTAARGDDELYDLMLADAVTLAPRIPHGARLIDVGVGAGAPGLAIALLRPDLRVTLVEPLTKRISFLRTVLGTIGRTDVALVKDKGEAVASREGRAWDVAISRATLAPAAWVPLGLRLAPSCWALLAKDEPPEIDGARIEEDISYTWPLTGASRRAVRYTVNH